MAYQRIELAAYPRRAHFEYFRSLSWPWLGTTVSVDVTPLLAYCRENRRSFYLTFMHAAALAAEGVRELRQRIHDGQIVEYDECPTSHIELLEDQSYCYCTLHHHMPLERYYEDAEQARRTCRQNGITEDEDAESMLFISTLPWLSYTALIQPVAGGDESNPRITWGKYEQDAQGRFHMPVTLLVHHALADGIHLAQFYGNLNAEIARFAPASGQK